MAFEHSWELDIFDQDLKDVFNSNKYRYEGGWDAFNIPIKSGTSKIKVVFTKYDYEEDYDQIENYCYFFDSEGSLVKKETLTVKPDKEDEIKRFWIDITEDISWLNISINPKDNLGIFRIPGIYNDDKENLKTRIEINKNLRAYSDPNTYEIAKDKNKNIFKSTRNQEEIDNWSEDENSFTPKNTNRISSSFYTIPEFYPRVDQHRIINPFDPKFIYVSREIYNPMCLFVIQNI